MLGRAAYQNAAILSEIDQRFYGAPAAEPDWNDLRDRMMAYAERHIAQWRPPAAP